MIWIMVVIGWLLCGLLGAIIANRRFFITHGENGPISIRVFTMLCGVGGLIGGCLFWITARE